MKISVIASVVASSEISSRHPRDIEIGEKRYSQLTDMMGFYNPDFDERKYWAYGCNCLILGDRPMSDPGHGPPVDALDSVCKQYKGKTLFNLNFSTNFLNRLCQMCQATVWRNVHRRVCSLQLRTEKR